MRAVVFRRELEQLFRLAVPLAVAQAGSQLMTVVDVAVLGRLGARELAGSGLANAVFFAFSVIGMGLVMGIDPLISQAIGAGDHIRARRAMWQGIWLALVVSGVLTAVLLIAAALLPFIGSAPELIAPARVYLVIRTMSLAPFLLFFVVRAYLQAMGMTRPMVVSMVAANILNFLGDLLFVFGGAALPDWTGPLQRVPAMGVAGAALATVLCTILQLAIVTAAVRNVEVPGQVDQRWSRKELAQAFRIGLPVGLQMGAEIGVFALVAVLASRLGTLHLAAHQLVIGLASFTFTVALGVLRQGRFASGSASARAMRWRRDSPGMSRSSAASR